MDSRTQYTAESEIKTLLNDVNQNPISNLEMHSFIRNFYYVEEKVDFNTLHNMVFEYYRHWPITKSGSLLMRVHAITIMAENNELPGVAEVDGDILDVRPMVFIAAAKCPAIEVNGDIVFDPEILLARIWAIKGNYSLEESEVETG